MENIEQVEQAMSEQSIKNYWNLPAYKREDVRTEVKEAEAEAEAEEKQLIRHKGKLYTAETFPCKCDLADPTQCYADKHDTDQDSLKQCTCKCHTYYDPW